MGELGPILERIERRVSMPEPAMERMLRRRERRERNERVAAAVMGLGIAAAGIAGAVVTLRVTTGTRPASEGGGAAAGAGGGFVLPTVAIWAAVVALGLTALAVGRLRARGERVDVGQEGRGPGGAAASARRRAAVPGTAPRKGGSEMDSQRKTETVPQVEMPEIRLDEARPRGTNPWVAVVVVLLAAAVAIAAAMLARSGQETTRGGAGDTTMPSASWLASPEVANAVEANAAALNAHDEATLAALFADAAVVTDTIAGIETTGPDAIAAFYAENGPSIEITSAVVGFDGSAAHSFTYPEGSGLLVFQYDDQMEIVHQWIMGSADGQVSGTEVDAPWVASPEVLQAVEESAAALNAADEAALAATYAAEGAVVTDTIAGIETTGPDAIAAFYAENGPRDLEITSAVVGFDNSAAHSFTHSGGSGLLVFEYDDQMKIVHQWIMGI